MSDPRFTEQDLYGRSGRPQARDIRQDDINDCYFLAPLGGLARAQPQRVQDAIRYDPENQAFQVTLYRPGADGKPEAVTLDVGQADIQDNLARRGGSTVDNQRGRDAPIWPAVMEIAYAELQAQGSQELNYAAIDMGHPSSALYALTGDPGENLEPDELRALGTDGAYERIRAALAEGRPVTIGTFQEAPGAAQDGLMDPHMYMVEGIRRKGDEVLLDLRNPYAHNRAHEGHDSRKATMTVSLDAVTREGLPGLYLNIGPAAQAGRSLSALAEPERAEPERAVAVTIGDRHLDALFAALDDPARLRQATQSLYDSERGQAIRAEHAAASEAQPPSRSEPAPDLQPATPEIAAPTIRR